MTKQEQQQRFEASYKIKKKGNNLLGKWIL